MATKVASGCVIGSGFIYGEKKVVEFMDTTGKIFERVVFDRCGPYAFFILPCYNPSLHDYNNAIMSMPNIYIIHHIIY